MDELTGRQEEILKEIQRYIGAEGYPPTIRDLSNQFRMAAPSMLSHIKALERKGVIRRRQGKSRGIELTGTPRMPSTGKVMEVPILGRVAAGAPLLAEENREGSIFVDNRFAKGQKLFALRVKGNSMVDAGLYENDVCIIRMTDTAQNNDIVVAFLDGEATVKRFRKSGKRITLLPENPAYEPIEISEEQGRDFRILGKVISLYRNI